MTTNLKEVYNICLNKNKINLFYYLLIIELIVIFFSFSSSSYMSYFWPDYVYFQYLHNLNVEKQFFEVLLHSNNFNGITANILNPFLNFLSFINYNNNNLEGYKLYLSLLRVCEIGIIFLHVNYFIKKISIIEIAGILLLYIAYLANTRGFDHHSYMNFPIIIFCFFHGLSLFFQKNNLVFFGILIIGNVWSYLINPIYFFVTCFTPLLFYYSFFIYKKNFQKIFFIFLANLICVIPFVLISLGTARMGASDLFPGSSPNYNFTIYQSKSFLILSIICIILAIKLIFEKREFFFSSLYLIISFLTLIFGFFYKYNTDNWKLPQPEYLDYAFQNIYIVIIFMILYFSKKNFFTYFLIAFFFLAFIYRSYNFTNNYIFHLKTPEIVLANKQGNYLKKFFWSDISEEYIFKKNLENKKILINLPNFDSELFNKSFDSDHTSQGRLELTKYLYNSDLKGSLSYLFFWKNNIVINEGHSQYLDLSSVLANIENLNYKYSDNLKYSKKDKLYLNGKKLIERQTIPLISHKNSLLDFYQVEYILSDVPLSHRLYKKYEFVNYSLYLYKYSAKNYDKTIASINYFDQFTDYNKINNKINTEVFIFKKQKKLLEGINKFCELNRISTESNNIIYDIKSSNEKCLAVFPITFSHNNNFYKIKNEKISKTKCETFRVQFFFHGCIIKGPTNIILKKNNIFYYHLGSIKDYLDLKEFKIKLF
jgi:hypothetical protein